MFSKTNIVTSIAFLTVIVLMTIMVSFALSGMNDIQVRLDHVVKVNAEKLRQVDIMRRANRERVIGLQLTLILDDPFEIDEMAMAHMSYANDFIAARTKLFEMAESPAEIASLEKIRIASMKAAPINDEIRDLALNDNQTAAKDLMIEHLVPVQDQIYAEFEALADLYEKEAERTNGNAREDYDVVLHRIIIMLSLVVVICSLIALKIIQIVTRSERALVKHSSELELLVDARTHELSREISERKRTERWARTESKRLAVTLASIGDGVVTIKPDNTVDYMNPAAERLTQFSTTQCLGHAVDNVLQFVDRASGEEKPLFTTTSADVNNEISNDDRVLRCNDGQLLDIQQTIASIIDNDGTTYGSVIVLRDVSEARTLERKLQHQASHDPLTGLVNRREFENIAYNMLKRVQIDNSKHCLCFIDLDKFKAINDSCGHSSGDTLLQELSERVLACIRKSDTFSRLGGDEFGLLLDHCDATKGREIAEDVRRTISEYRLRHQEREFSVGASIGLVEVTSDNTDLQSLLHLADEACYKAKELGRDCIHISTSEKSNITQVSSKHMAN